MNLWGVGKRDMSGKCVGSVWSAWLVFGSSPLGRSGEGGVVGRALERKTQPS